MEIVVEQLEEEPWEFAVGLREADENLGDYLVTMSEDEYTNFGQGAEPKDLIQATFRFLLDREEPEMIMDRFCLQDILQYFPEYPVQLENYF
jgi:hypothetical protein